MKDNPKAKNNVYDWATYYFNYFNIFFPVLSKPHFMRQLSHRHHQNVDHLLLYAVSAIGSQYSNSDGNNEQSQFYFEKCMAILNTSLDTATLSTVQVNNNFCLI